MKISNRWVSVVIFSALLRCFTSAVVEAGQEKTAPSNRGGKASAHTSGKGIENSNAQWSADPEKGWVRADERHKLRDERHSTEKSKKNGGKPKDQNTKGKRVAN
jgi:hypothetical protein